MEVNCVVKHVFFQRVHKKIDQVRKVDKRAKQSRRQRAFKRQQARERMMFMFLLCSTFLHISMPTRTVWENERRSQWWERIVNQTFTANDWQTNFRMSKSICAMSYDRKLKKGHRYETSDFSGKANSDNSVVYGYKR